MVNKSWKRVKHGIKGNYMWRRKPGHEVSMEKEKGGYQVYTRKANSRTSHKVFINPITRKEAHDAAQMQMSMIDEYGLN